MKNKILLLVLSILCFSCHCKKDMTAKISNISAENVHRKWMLTSYNGFTKEDLIAKKAFLDLTNKERATSKMGCNNLSFGYTVVGNSITFTQGISTRMFCEDMRLENEFSANLPKLTTITIQGHKLTLTGKDNQKMEFIAEDWD